MGLWDIFKRKPVVEEKASAAPAKVLKVSDFLSEKNISFFPAGPSKQQVFGQLISLLNLPDPSSVMQAIMAREEAGTTVIAPGIALPHARIPGITKIRAAIGLCPSGVEDPSSPSGPVRIFILFLGPSENMREHLAFLAGVSSLFQIEGLIDSLFLLATPSDVLKKIKDVEAGL
jgi:PTS system nitrogen regulatory IIA component